MKYIRLFEEKVNGNYWRINCKSPQYISLSLKKIGLTPDNEIYQDIMNDKNFGLYTFQSNYFYICNGYCSTGNWWYYSTNLSQFKNVYKYQGQVKIDDFELDTDKYNL